MMKLSTSFLCCLLLVACEATSPPAYDRDKAPEDRKDYSGLEGATQMLKDKSYLMDKELRDKCINAKVALAVAQSEGKQDDIKLNRRIIQDTCT